MIFFSEVVVTPSIIPEKERLTLQIMYDLGSGLELGEDATPCGNGEL